MIELDTSGDSGFSIAIAGKTLIRHSAESPFFIVGQGVSEITMRYSNYKLRDQVTRKIAPGAWQVRESSNFGVIIDFTNLGAVAFGQDGDAVSIRFIGFDDNLDRFWLTLEASADEHIYGCGEQYSELDLRGKRVPIWVQEQGVGRGKDLITLLANLHSGSGGAWHTTYFAQPTFVSSANYSCHIEATSYAELDFRPADRHVLHTWQIPSRVRIEVRDTAPEVIAGLSRHLGRQPELPAWTHDGVWLGLQGGRDVVQEKLDAALDADTRVAAVWAQDWQGIRVTSFGKQLEWNWRHDDTLYPDLPGTIEQLAARGIRFLGYINPMLVPEGDLYQEAREKGYLVKDRQGEVAHVTITSFPAGLVDFDNPAACTWYKTIIKDHMIGIGLAGWMADFGEALPTDAALYSGRDAALAHNDYPVQWARVNREAVEETGKLGQVVFFMRAGAAGSSRHALAHWAGDQLVNWSLDDGFATVIPAAISLGFCGVGQFHSDIGGYTTVAWIKRTKELFMRWCEQAVFSPIMRTHEGNRPGSNWQFDSDRETLEHFSRMSRIYVHLRDYHRAVGREYAETGVPPTRHPYIHYEDDEVVHTLKYQYLYGRDILVAPVIRRKARTMRVYLPADDWLNAWTGEKYRAGWHQIATPSGQTPVFYREASEHRTLLDGLRDVA